MCLNSMQPDLCEVYVTERCFQWDHEMQIAVYTCVMEIIGLLMRQYVMHTLKQKKPCQSPLRINW